MLRPPRFDMVGVTLLDRSVHVSVERKYQRVHTCLLCTYSQRRISATTITINMPQLFVNKGQETRIRPHNVSYNS